MVTGAQRLKLFSIAFIALFSLFITAQAFAASASFTASVDRDTVGAGESFRLELSLSGASPKGSPDFTPLEKDFTIASKGQSSQATIINNRVSRSIKWQLVLIAPIAGDYQIPSLSINTDEGRLKSDPLKISIQKSSAPTPQAGASGTTGTAPKALSVQTDISTRTPYLNEPVLYTVKLVAARSVGDVGIPEFTIPDAVVEKLGDAKVYDARAGGSPVKVIEARYLITPLKSGKIKIPPYIFQGQVVSDVQRGRRSLFNDPFFDMPDPFGMFEGFGNFATYEPFAIAGDKVTLDVKAPAAAMDPWLPLYDLQISEDLSGAEDAKVGQPLTLSLTMVAKGVSGKVLPDLSGQIRENGDFKIYADKPKTSEDISKDGKTVSGWRQESYTLIPQKSGSLTLPEIKVPWWNIPENKISYAIVPEHTIYVKAGAVHHMPNSQPVITNSEASKPVPQSDALPTPQKSTASNISEAQTVQPNLMHLVVSVLGLFSIILLGIVLFLLNRLNAQKHTGSQSLDHAPIKTKKISKKEIKQAKTSEELKNKLQAYAHENFGTSPNASLINIYQKLILVNPNVDNEENKQIFLDLDSALYAGKKITLEQSKTDLLQILRIAEKPKKSGLDQQEIRINPS